MSSGVILGKSLALQSLTVNGVQITGNSPAVGDTVLPAIYAAGKVTMDTSQFSVTPVLDELPAGTYRAVANWAPSTGQTVPTDAPGATPITLSVSPVGALSTPVLVIKAGDVLTAPCDINWFIIQLT